MSPQTRQLQEDWRSLTVQQTQRELELKEKEKELIARREELERERLKISGEINHEFEQLQDFKTDFGIKLNNACQFITSHANDFIFPNPQAKRIFQVFSLVFFFYFVNYCSIRLNVKLQLFTGTRVEI
jgi:hypothetical protein